MVVIVPIRQGGSITISDAQARSIQRIPTGSSVEVDGRQFVKGLAPATRPGTFVFEDIRPEEVTTGFVDVVATGPSTQAVVVEGPVEPPSELGEGFLSRAIKMQEQQELPGLAQQASEEVLLTQSLLERQQAQREAEELGRLESFEETVGRQPRITSVFQPPVRPGIGVPTRVEQEALITREVPLFAAAGLRVGADTLIGLSQVVTQPKQTLAAGLRVGAEIISDPLGTAVGVGRAARAEPSQFLGELAGGALLFGVAGKAVSKVGKVVPKRAIKVKTIVDPVRGFLIAEKRVAGELTFQKAVVPFAGEIKKFGITPTKRVARIFEGSAVVERNLLTGVSKITAASELTIREQRTLLGTVTRAKLKPTETILGRSVTIEAESAIALKTRLGMVSRSKALTLGLADDSLFRTMVRTGKIQQPKISFEEFLSTRALKARGKAVGFRFTKQKGIETGLLARSKFLTRSLETGRAQRGRAILLAGKKPTPRGAEILRVGVGEFETVFFEGALPKARRAFIERQKRFDDLFKSKKGQAALLKQIKPTKISLRESELFGIERSILGSVTPVVSRPKPRLGGPRGAFITRRDTRIDRVLGPLEVGRARVKARPISKVISRVRPRVATRERFESRFEQALKEGVRTIPRTKAKVRTRTTTRPRTPTPPRAPSVTETNAGLLGAPRPTRRVTPKRKVQRRPTRRVRGRRTPSFTAVVQQIRGKPQKKKRRFTGLELRPILEEPKNGGFLKKLI